MTLGFVRPAGWAKGFVVLAGLASITIFAAAQEPKIKLDEDPPLATQPKSGGISGKITFTGQISRLQALCRATQKTYEPAEFDKASGKFVFKDLPGDAAYDLIVKTADGRSIEGIDLSPNDARLLRLSDQRRQQLGLPPERRHEFTQDDAKALADFVAKMKDFMEIRRVLYIRGHGMRAAMLVELMRTREFHSSGGDIVWRVEVWQFQEHLGGWERLVNTEQVLERKRIKGDEFKAVSAEYYPQLSIYVDGEGKSSPVEFAIPAKTDPSCGRPAGGDCELKTAPHILGVGSTGYVPASRPASGPAGKDGNASGQNK